MTMQPAVYLQDLFVDAAMRGIGGGRQLIEAVGDAAREAGRPDVLADEAGQSLSHGALYDRLAKHAGSIVYVYTL